jgi:hypothetical protein
MVPDQAAAGHRQENSTVEEGADPRKWEVGRRLRFIGYAKGEIESEAFKPGDIVLPVARNACGMGIDVRREDHPDAPVDPIHGFLAPRPGIDMVWPEEVEIVP